MSEGDTGVGTVAQQLARLEHARDRHGLEAVICPRCYGVHPKGCPRCDETGVVFTGFDPTVCGPDCRLLEARPV